MIQDDLWHMDLMDNLGLNQPIHGEHDFYGSKHVQMSQVVFFMIHQPMKMLDFSGWHGLSNKRIWMELFSLEFLLKWWMNKLIVSKYVLIPLFFVTQINSHVDQKINVITSVPQFQQCSKAELSSFLYWILKYNG